MSDRHRRPIGTEPYDENSEIARRATERGGGLTAIVVSGLALIFSGISLYQTVIKQAQLHIFLPDTVNYTRDPDGSFEVFVLPITVSNTGARDGVLSAMKLEVRNIDTGKTKTLHASYFTAPGTFPQRRTSSTTRSGRSRRSHPCRSPDAAVLRRPFCSTHANTRKSASFPARVAMN